MYKQRLTNKFKLKGTHTKCEYDIMGQFYPKMTDVHNILIYSLYYVLLSYWDCKISIRKWLDVESIQLSNFHCLSIPVLHDQVSVYKERYQLLTLHKMRVTPPPL